MALDVKAWGVATDRIVRHAGKVKVDDLDWQAAARVGLTEDEAFVVTYFADIEGQTLANLRTLLAMRDALSPTMTAFLTTWSYEEFFHGHALSRLLAVSGRVCSVERVAEVHAQALWKERMERLLSPLASYLFAAEFPAVYMTFGAIHELTTLRGYERLELHAHNPVLRALSARIAKQERRHFAFYFRQAREKLRDDRRAQLLTRTLLRFYFAPVGAGVKGAQAIRRLYRTLFPGAHGPAMCADVDARIASLPGLAGMRPMHSYFAGPSQAGAGLDVLLARGTARAEVLLARGTTRAEVLLARGTARFDTAGDSVGKRDDRRWLQVGERATFPECEHVSEPAGAGRDRDTTTP